MPAGDSTLFPRIAGALALVPNGLAFFGSVDSNHTLDVQVFDPATFAPVQFIKNWTQIAGSSHPSARSMMVAPWWWRDGLVAHEPLVRQPPTMDPAHDYRC